MKLPEIAPDPVFTFADDLEWPIGRLRVHTKLLLQQKESANSRKEVVLEREIGHAAYELIMREQEQKQLEAQIAQEPVEVSN